MPPVPLHSFFSKEAGSGPHGVPCFVGKPKLLQNQCESVYELWLKQLQNLKNDISPSDAVTKALGDHKAAKAKVTMEVARQKAKTELANKRRRMTISLKT